MTTEIVTVGPDATFAEIVDTLVSNDVSGVPVVDGTGRLLGIVTEADLVSREAYGPRRRRALGLLAEYFRGRDPQWVRKSAALKARELMTAAPDTAGPDEDLMEPARRMLEHHRKRLPVVEHGRIVGIVARQDLLQHFRGPEAR
jgi:CBS domain-containing protein